MQYDAAFNPTTFRGAARSFNANNQDAAQSYDGNGNPGTLGAYSLTFDPENRLTSVGSSTITTTPPTALVTG